MLRHLSVDFWHTLGEPNPAYAALRSQTLAEFYGVSVETAEFLYKNLKRSWEASAVETGRVPDLAALRGQLRNLLERDLTDSRWEAMLAQLNQLFAENPPSLNQHALDKLRLLRMQLGLTLSVGSNTNFIIRGETIRSLLPERLFHFQLYSDQLGRCKPCPQFYANVLVQAAKRNPKVTRPADVGHVGDNLLCDVEAPMALGLRAWSCGHGTPVTGVFDRIIAEETYGELTSA
jgi:FMN phosphatase YigB (HAD superfamily)